MEHKVLVVNSGSSTLKFKLFASPEDQVLIKGMVDRLGSDQSILEITYQGNKESQKLPIKSHLQAVKIILQKLIDLKVITDVQEITGIGHRLVSGGPYFDNSILLNKENVDKLAQIDEFAPLHNPAERKGIEAFAQMLPKIPQVAVFDTTFHKKIPKMNQIYSIPKEYDEKFGAHRYGAHGTSHDYVSHKAAEFLQLPYDEQKIVSLHMGSGVSITAIKDGHSFDTSMGFTPMAGVTMSSRAGDIDISLVAFLMEKLKLNNINDMISILNNESGLKGISGVSPDMRDLLAVEDTNPDAKLAINVFINRIVKYVGSYIAEMNGIDIMIFTAGMGENNPSIREDIMNNFNFLGLKVDKSANEKGEGIRKITANDSKITALVVPTDEELMIVHEFERLVQ